MRLARNQAIPKYLLAGITLALLSTSTIAFAEDLTIFDSRRPVALSDKEVTYRDFYINGGVEQGIKKDMVLSVTRRLTLYDSYRANSPKEMMVEVAKVKVIFTQKGISVARYYEGFDRIDRTILEYDFIMVGDKIDMSSAQMESQLKKKAVNAQIDSMVIPKSIGPTETASLASSQPAIPAPENSQPAPLNSLQ